MGEVFDALSVALKAALGFQAIFFALLAIGINVQFGYTGLLNFGQIALAPWETSKRYAILGTSWSGAELWVGLVGWGIVALSCVLVWLLMRSPWGRVVKSVREDEDAVRALGKNVYVYKMQALVLGGVFGAFGGMVYAVGSGSAIPVQYHTP